MRTPVEIWDAVMNGDRYDCPSLREAALKAIALAQAEAAREQFEADCAAQCLFCRDGFPISVAMPKEVLFRHSLPYQCQHTVLCRAALLRRDFACRHPEVKA